MRLEPLWATGSQLSPALRYTLTGHTDAIYAAACSTLPDGRVIAITAGYDDTVRVWNPVAGEMLSVHPLWSAPYAIAIAGTTVVVTVDWEVVAFEL